MPESWTEVWFNGVMRMELDNRFDNGLTITPVTRHGDLDDGAALPLLLLRLTGTRFGSGFVACSNVAVQHVRREGTQEIVERVLVRENASRSVHGVGGRPAEPGETAFGTPVLHRYSREKRTTPRFPPPPDKSSTAAQS